MIRRVVHSIAFLVHSPSHWQVAEDLTGRPFSALHFTLEPDGRWWLAATMHSGQTIRRSFASRDAAFELFSSRQQASA